MSDESEEKTLQASRRKLRKQRDRGSVVTSREAVMSLTGIVALIYLYTSRLTISEKLTALWELEPAPGQTFAVQFQSKMSIVSQLGVEVVMPLVGLVIIVGILGGLMVAGGPVFMSFLMNVVRLTVLTLVFGLILLSGWQALILAPVCGMGCAMDTLQGVILPMVIGAVAVMAFMAIFDYLVQRAEFLREQMMSITEFKREMKDAMGDPHLRGHLKQERKSMLTTTTGPGFATIMVSSGNSLSIGVRYVTGETPAPLIVAKARRNRGRVSLMIAPWWPRSKASLLAATSPMMKRFRRSPLCCKAREGQLQLDSDLPRPLPCARAGRGNTAWQMTNQFCGKTRTSCVLSGRTIWNGPLDGSSRRFARSRRSR